ncbi:MAG: peptidylprolyl isomerase [Vicinamibacteria bacterium]|nr:peptidylprolyl isomerase [Vicinamibacteria bacterium]
MLLISLLLLLQGPTEQAILEAEHARAEDVSVLLKGLESPDVRLQRLAVRAMGRLERPALRDAIAPLARSGDASVRAQAIAALAQTGVPFDYASLLQTEKAGAVRAVIYESMGRAKPVVPGAEARLVLGLEDEDLAARTGAARGLETLVRQNIKTTRPAPPTLEALRRVFRENRVPRLRQFALLTLNAAGDHDAATLDLALRDEDPQVRRLAVIGSKRWVDDPSPVVRLEAVRLAANCERAQAAVEDPAGHVALAAVDALGALKCDALAIEPLLAPERPWRVRSRALVALAKVAPDRARARMAPFREDPRWQVRAYAAVAAKQAADEAALAALARDSHPGVAAAALATEQDAVRALASDHAGLLVTAASRLKGSPELRAAAPRIAETILRLSRGGRVTVRDPRMQLIERLREAGDPEALATLKPLLSDRDPVVADLVARALTESTGKTVEPSTRRYVPEPFPTEAARRALEGARAVVTMQGLGSFTLLLMPEEAPATVATFAGLAEKGAYNGLTFHRVVPNFVLQGGSPGADEYDALTPQFMRDELGLASNERGTIGTSTRGHDTGDGQIFVNLVDNWRLDHVYTVFARVVEGMDVVDRILEGDVIESVRIQRRH